MSVVIDESIVGIWYAMTSEDEDFMLAVSRREDGLEMVYRHRYYNSPDDPWDEKDRKSWYRMVSKQKDEAKAIETAREMVSGVIAIAMRMKRIKGDGVMFELLRGESSVEEFGERLRAMPWAHSQQVTLQ